MMLIAPYPLSIKLPSSDARAAILRLTLPARSMINSDPINAFAYIHIGAQASGGLCHPRVSSIAA